jgi:hypothetical protein
VKSLKVAPVSDWETAGGNSRVGKATYCDEEARGPVVTVKRLGKQLEPRIIAVHEKLACVFGLELGQPGVLGGQCGRGVGFVKVEDKVDKGGDRSRGDGLDPRHRHCRRPSIGREGNGAAFADEAIRDSGMRE